MEDYDVVSKKWRKIGSRRRSGTPGDIKGVI
jgi:hypothetical protein